MNISLAINKKIMAFRRRVKKHLGMKLLPGKDFPVDETRASVPGYSEIVHEAFSTGKLIKGAWCAGCGKITKATEDAKCSMCGKEYE